MNDVVTECNSGIYQIRNLLNNKRYIGSSSNLNKRKKRHFNDLKRNKGINKYMQNAFNKYGEENFVFEVIEFIEDITKSILIEKEQYWMNYYKCYDRKNGYNLSPTSSSNFGLKMSDETKYKISQKLKNRYKTKEDNPLYGTHRTENTKKKISLYQKGRIRKPLTIEQKNKIGDGNRGKKLSEETKQKMSESHKGIKSPKKGKLLSEETKQKMSESRKGKRSNNTKLTEENVIEIKSMLLKNIKVKEIALIFKISKRQIYDIKKGKIWKDVCLD